MDGGDLFPICIEGHRSDVALLILAIHIILSIQIHRRGGISKRCQLLQMQVPQMIFNSIFQPTASANRLIVIAEFFFAWFSIQEMWLFIA